MKLLDPLAILAFATIIRYWRWRTHRALSFTPPFEAAAPMFGRN